jgi:hypothetical protein
MPKSHQQQQQQDLATPLEELKSIFTQIDTEIEQLSQPGELAPPGTWIVRYRARGKGGTYWYYKWQSREAIFVTKSGNKSRHKYIGKAGSPVFIKAVEMMKGRTQIEGLQQVKHTWELGLEDLVEEATRFQDKNGSPEGEPTNNPGFYHGRLHDGSVPRASRPVITSTGYNIILLISSKISRVLVPPMLNRNRLTLFITYQACRFFHCLP